MVTSSSTTLGWAEWHCHAKCERVSLKLKYQQEPLPLGASHETANDKANFMHKHRASKKRKRNPSNRIAQKVVFLHVEKTVRVRVKG